MDIQSRIELDRLARKGPSARADDLVGRIVETLAAGLNSFRGSALGREDGEWRLVLRR